MKQLKVSGIVPESIVDGPGVRYVIFTQGCPHHCPGCHNPQTHTFHAGKWTDISELLEDMEQNPLISGVTFSGGEPFCQAEALFWLANAAKKRGKHILIYSGYTWEELYRLPDPYALKLLTVCDWLIDGRFKLEQRDLTLPFRGSRNQRIIDLPKTLACGEIVAVKEEGK